jgi:hypothetical protein
MSRPPERQIGSRVLSGNFISINNQHVVDSKITIRPIKNRLSSSLQTSQRSQRTFLSYRPVTQRRACRLIYPSIHNSIFLRACLCIHSPYRDRSLQSNLPRYSDICTDLRDVQTTSPHRSKKKRVINALIVLASVATTLLSLMLSSISS